MNKRRVWTLIVLLLIGAPLTARADAGLPLIAVLLPPMWIALIPVILIEAEINRRRFSVPFRKTVGWVSLGNIASTIVGIPLVWIFFATIEGIFFGEAKGLDSFPLKAYAVTIQAPWLIPYEDDLKWMIPVALVVFSVPCFIVSVAIEAPINKLGAKDLSKIQVWKTTALSNFCSYIFLALLTVAIFYAGNHVEWLFSAFDTISEWFAGAVFRIARLFVHGG